MSTRVKYFVIMELYCEECEGTGFITHPAWAQYDKALTQAKKDGNDLPPFEAWFSENGYTSIPDEEITCTECEGLGVTHIRAELQDAIASLAELGKIDDVS